MKILVIADQESRYYWDFFDKSKFEGIDLIVSCGDLKSEYLSFLVTMTSLPVLYVHGNHDDHYKRKPPEGCVCIEDKVYEYNGVRFFGLGGSMKYKDGDHMYTESSMRRRVLRDKIRLVKSRGFDVLVTHAPAAGHGDAEDLPHNGFKVFEELLDKYRPKYFLHGHVHMNYGVNVERESEYNGTKIVNAYERYIIEI